MLIKTLVLGPVETNCYIVTDESCNECAVIDPGDESNSILDYLEDNKLKCKAILLTHGHYDHVGAVYALAEETGALIYINQKDVSDAPNAYFPLKASPDLHYYSEGDIVCVAGLSFSVIETPGHTPGSVSLICEDALFSGDTLFRGTCGRFDLPGGDELAILNSLNRLCKLQGDYEVYPGHMEGTTLNRERSNNYFCRKAL